MKKIRIHPPVIFFIFIIMMWALHSVVPLKMLFNHPINYIGVFFIVDGLTMIIWAAKLFKERETAIIPFEKSSHLVIDGPYQFTRNPMYLGMAGMLARVGMVLGSLTPLVLPFIFVKIIEQQFILPEEAMMKEGFGDEYSEYKSSVRRWL